MNIIGIPSRGLHPQGRRVAGRPVGGSPSAAASQPRIYGRSIGRWPATMHANTPPGLRAGVSSGPL